MIRWCLPPFDPRDDEAIYRDDLAAAHARIAALEEKVRHLQEVEARRKREGNQRNPNRLALSALLPVILFCGLAVGSPQLHGRIFPVLGLCVGIVLGALVWLVVPSRRH